MKSIYVLLVSLILSSSVQAEPELKGVPSDLETYLAGVPKTMSIKGTGEEKVPADRVLVSIRVTTENKSLEQGLSENQKIREEIAKVLTDKGIPADRIQSARFSSTPRKGIFSDKTKSYKLDNSIKVTVQDEKEFQTVAAIIDKWTEAEIGETEFKRSDEDTLKKKALASACEDAVTKKKIFEDNLGVTLTPVRISEGPVWVNAPIPREMVLEGVEVMKSFAPSAYAPAASASFGELIFSAEVTIEFKLLPE